MCVSRPIIKARRTLDVTGSVQPYFAHAGEISFSEEIIELA